MLLRKDALKEKVILRSELPTSMDACHTCDNPSCINPEHLWAGTRTQNLLDASKKGRTQGKSHPPIGTSDFDGCLSYLRQSQLHQSRTPLGWYSHSKFVRCF